MSYLLVSFSMTGGCGMTVLVDANNCPIVTHLDEGDQVTMGQLFARMLSAFAAS